MKSKAGCNDDFPKANPDIIFSKAPGSLWPELPRRLILRVFTQSWYGKDWASPNVTLCWGCRQRCRRGAFRFEEPVGKTSQHNVHCSAGILYCGAGHTGDFSSKRAPQTPCCFRLNTITHVNIHYISKNSLAYVNIFHTCLLASLGGLWGSQDEGPSSSSRCSLIDICFCADSVPGSRPSCPPGCLALVWLLSGCLLISGAWHICPPEAELPGVELLRSLFYPTIIPMIC